MTERFRNDRLLRKVGGKFVEIQPDGSVKEETAPIEPPKPIAEKPLESTTEKPQKPVTKTTKYKPYASSEKRIKPIKLEHTATKFKNSGKERIVVKDQSRGASDEGGPHILEPKRDLTQLERFNKQVQEDKSEIARGSVPDYSQKKGKIIRSRGRTGHKPSWKLGRKHQRRGPNQSHWER